MKHFVIYIDGSENDRESLAVALRAAAATNARLSVIYQPPGGAQIYGGAEYTMVMDVSEIGAREKAAAKAVFDEVCGGLNYVAWADPAGDIKNDILVRSLFCDLIILDRLSSEDGPEAQRINTAVFETGMPVLITPPKAMPTFAKTIVACWKHSFQAARAIKSSIPLLRQANNVILLCATSNTEASTASMISYLTGHDVKVNAQGYDSSGLTARARGRNLLNAAQDLGGDLLVAGAFGINSLDDVFGLGRATRKIVTGAQIPVFIQS